MKLNNINLKKDFSSLDKDTFILHKKFVDVLLFEHGVYHILYSDKMKLKKPIKKCNIKLRK